MIGGTTFSRGAGEEEIVLFTLQNSSFAYCGDLISTENLELVTTSVISNSSWVDSTIDLNITLSYLDSLSLSSVSVTTTNLFGSLITTDGGIYCDTVAGASSSQLEVNSDNPCGCSQFGTCSDGGRCSCYSGYSGPFCSYTIQDYDSLSSSI